MYLGTYNRVSNGTLVYSIYFIRIKKEVKGKHIVFMEEIWIQPEGFLPGSYF